MKKQLYKYLLFTFLCLIAVLLALVIHPRMPKTGDVTAFTRYLDSQIPLLMAKHKVQGASVALIHNSQVEYIKGFGYADAEKTTPITGDTLFQVASISKAVTGWGVMNLVEDGLLDLDTPVSKYLTRWQLPASKFELDQVTIRRMLSHSSGIAHVGGYAGVNSPSEMQTIEESLTSPVDGDKQGVRVIYQPGSKYQYSGGAFTLLQLVIEEVSGQSFETYMKNEILNPLGMTSSSFEADPTGSGDISGVFNGKGESVARHYFSSKAAAGLYASAHDMAMFELGMMLTDDTLKNDGVLTADTMREMYNPQPGLPRLLPYGLGVMLQPLRSPETIQVSHTGSNLPGWNSIITTLPNKGEGLVLLTNSTGGSQLRTSISSAWLYWSAGQYSNAVYITKLTNSLIIVVPVWIIGMLLLRFVPKLKTRVTNK